jgi:hypothetical protein
MFLCIKKILKIQPLSRPSGAVSRSCFMCESLDACRSCGKDTVDNVVSRAVDAAEAALATGLLNEFHSSRDAMLLFIDLTGGAAGEDGVGGMR